MLHLAVKITSLILYIYVARPHIFALLFKHKLYWIIQWVYYAY